MHGLGLSSAWPAGARAWKKWSFAIEAKDAKSPSTLCILGGGLLKIATLTFTFSEHCWVDIGQLYNHLLHHLLPWSVPSKDVFKLTHKGVEYLVPNSLKIFVVLKRQ